jgi:arylsulfatase A-like enzyme
MRFDRVFTPAPTGIPSQTALFSGRHLHSSGVIGKSTLPPLSRHPFDHRKYPKARTSVVFVPEVRGFLAADDAHHPMGFQRPRVHEQTYFVFCLCAAEPRTGGR